jgi:hypothetical protein
MFIADSNPAAVVAVEMWEPASYAGFQAPGVKVGNSPLLVTTVPAARHFHSEAGDSAHFRHRQP